MLVCLFFLCLAKCAFCLQDEVSQPAHSCGVMTKSAGISQGGYESQREAFPWVANIFSKYLGATLYAGSGSLISDRHILCAANSVAYENYLGDSLDLNPDKSYIPYDGENIKIILGTSHYKNSMNESGALVIDSTLKVILHPKVAGTKPRTFNVALIFLKESVQFSKYISPVCLWSSVKNQDDILGKTVYAVGFGVDHTGVISGFKKQVAMVVLENKICQRFYANTLQKTKDSKFFCARGNGIETPCRYDKPLYIKIGDQWFLQAMSSTFKVFKTRACRPRAPVLYEDVSTLTSWVESEIGENDL
ncbi:CLUMA_CG017023, isoform A [Clunio marinus]|uniref:CLUMA_CG017023, isoform A n=1 Tax=Clunio marinus TaxID=568069 RepID=A0A1J1IWF7_9DIPT|nr:CLUMA_CG017023, isoform A [Clunio marinus]